LTGTELWRFGFVFGDHQRRCRWRDFGITARKAGCVATSPTTRSDEDLRAAREQNAAPLADVTRERFWNVPNALTVSRLAMAIPVFALIAFGRYTAALAIFGLAVITDWLDGYLARRLNQATSLGRQLDPLVDKVIVCGGFVYLLTIQGTGLAPWMVTAIIARELLIQGLRSFLEGQGEPFGARWAGKVKTTFQCLAIIGILLCLAVNAVQPWLWVRDALIWGAVGLTLYSGIAYLAAGLPRIHLNPTTPSAS
jgi:CDP-diacylglycerol--glycerol-3-phosphate 3-phosphatidyltransferase